MGYGPAEKTGAGQLVELIQAQESSSTTSKKSSKGTRKPAWMNKELLTKLKDKKNAYKRREQGQVSWDKFRHTALV